MNGVRGTNGILATDFGISQPDIIQDRSRKDVEVLKHNTDSLPECLAAIPIDVNAIKINHAIVNIIESHQKADER